MHTPDIKNEMFRIYNSKGEIRDTIDGQRISLRARMYPGLKVSRTIGDLIPHQIGITSEPSFVVHNIDTAFDKLFLMASSGLWEYFTPEEVTDTVNNMTADERTPGQITQMLWT